MLLNLSSILNRNLISAGRQSIRNKFYKNHKKDIVIELQGEFLYGIHPVRMALKADKRKFHKIYYNRNSEKSVRIAKVAESLNIPTQQMSRFNLDQMTKLSARYKDHHVHQGIVADVSRLYPVPVDYYMPQLPELQFDYSSQFGNENFILLLYDIKDPMNLGAILRSAYFFGVNTIIMGGKKIDLSCIVSKASSGALEVVSLYSVRDIEKHVEFLKGHGWQILTLSAPTTSTLGTCTDDQITSVPLNQVTLETKSVLIVGSEGTGIPDEILRISDKGIFIPSLSKDDDDMTRIWEHENQVNNMSHEEIVVEEDLDTDEEDREDEQVAYIDSLNVSVATGIALNQLLSTRSL